MWAWKTRLWAKAMDPWLSPFNETEREESLLVKGGKGAGAVGAALLVKIIDGPSPSCPTASALICSTPLLLCATLIFSYWSSSSSRPISVSGSLSQVASFAARVNATYSASVDDKATVAYRLERQLTRSPFSMKMNLDVDFLVTWSPAKSESEQHLMINFPLLSPLYVIPTVLVAFRYRMMVFKASVCCREGFLANRLTTDVAKTMSGLVSTIENISDPVMPWYCFCSAWLA